MKEKGRLKWSQIALAVLLTMSLALPAAVLLTMSLPAPALANEELHPGGRLFFPYWDAASGRSTFIILTRLALFPVDQGTTNYSADNNCKPGHTTAFPTPTGSTNSAVDDVHLEWYGKTCNSKSEIIHMSCGDVDLVFLDANNLATHTAGGNNTGALDVHFILNNSNDPIKRVHENSLMGEAVVTDATAGWAAVYPAAAAKSTQCTFCDVLDSGTEVGYEPFPLEVFLPFAFADGSIGGPTFTNLLSLWAPTVFPGAAMPANFNILWNWYDGRERRFSGDLIDHSFVRTLSSMDPIFGTANWTCGHALTSGVAENDGFARSGTNPNACGTTSVGDTAHPSDELDVQNSNSLGWWDINKSGDSASGFPDYTGLSQARRGLVGVVLASTVESGKQSNADFIRLWHKDPCNVAPRGTFGPPHLRDRAFRSNNNYLVTFNSFTPADQRNMCNRTSITTPPGGFPPFETSAP